MPLPQLFSLAYPTDAENQEIFRQRAFRFFGYSIANMMGLIYGAGLISLVLYTYGAEKKSTALLFLLTAVIAIVLIFFLST